MTDLNLKKYVGSNFLKVDHLRDGPRREVIAGWGENNFGRPEITFVSRDVLSLNDTNTRILIDHYGENSRDSIGAEVELYLGKVKYKGEMQDSILLRPLTPPRKFDERTPPPADDPPPSYDDKDLIV